MRVTNPSEVEMTMNSLVRKLVFPLSFFSTTLLGAVNVFAAGFPVGAPAVNQPMLIMRSSGNPCGQGDSITCAGANGLTSNKASIYVVEVPPGTGELRIELLDADAGVGGAVEAADGRDQNASATISYDYRVQNPSGVAQTAASGLRFDRGDSTSALAGVTTGLRSAAVSVVGVSCQSTDATSQSGDNKWCTLFRAANPVAGRWQISMTPSTADAQIQAVGVRAVDAISARDLNIYVPTTIHIGNQTVDARRDYTGVSRFYPYVTSGCSLREGDFDNDSSAASSFNLSYVGPSAALLQTLTEAANTLSINDGWNYELISHAPLSASLPAAVRYGIWQANLNLAGTGANHTSHWFSSELTSTLIPTTSPEPGSFRIYFPDNTGNAPKKPYMLQSVQALVSGPALLTVGSASQLKIALELRNPTMSAITFNASNLVTIAVPSGVAYANPSFTATCGSVVSQPADNASGNITWNPGVMAAGSGCKAEYQVRLTPAVAGSTALTGNGAASGTRYDVLDETNSPFSFGPLCPLSVTTGTNYATVPVTIGEVRGHDDGASLHVQFQSLSETATRGYFVDMIGAGQKTQRLNPTIIAAKAKTTVTPTDYQVDLPSNESHDFYIVEVTFSGKEIRYGPYRTDRDMGKRVEPPVTPWSQIITANSAVHTAVHSRSKSNSIRVSLAILQTDIYRVTHGDLIAAGIDLTGVPASDIAITRQGQAIARVIAGGFVFGPGSWIEFVGEKDSADIYNRATRLLLTIDASKALDMTTTDVASSPGPVIRTGLTTITLDASQSAQPVYNLSSPLSDPWSYAAMSGGTSSSSLDLPFDLPGYQVSNQDEILLSMWGGLDYPGPNPDHQISAKINNGTMSIHRFDGVNPATFVFAAKLRATNNHVQLGMLPLAEFATDRVNLQSLSIQYQRALTADQGRLRWQQSDGVAALDADAVFHDGVDDVSASAGCARQLACNVYEASGFANADIRAYELTDDHQVQQLAGNYRQNDGAGFAVRVVTDQKAANIFMANGDAVRTPVITNLFAQETLLSGAATFFVIADPAFLDAVTPLVTARNAAGIASRLVSTQDIYATYGDGGVSPAAIKRFIRNAHAAEGTQYVLLVGGDSYDYKNYLGLGSRSFVPTYYLPVPPYVRYAPSDLPYADINDDGSPDLAVGRFPSRTPGEVTALVNKTLRSQLLSDAKLLLVADRDNTGYDYAGQSELMHSEANPIGASLTQSIFLQNYPSTQAGVDQARALLATSVNQGVRLLNYFGHSSPLSWAQSGLLTTTQLQTGLLTNDAHPFVLTQWGCYGAYFVSPQYDTLAHQLLNSTYGASAIIGSSSLTETGNDSVLAAYLLPELAKKKARLGDAWRNALVQSRAANLQANDVLTTTILLGDPTATLGD
jgi:hypothetical protein